MRYIRLLAVLLSLGIAFACISCDIREIQIESGEPADTEGDAKAELNFGIGSQESCMENSEEKKVDRIVLRYHGNPYNAITIYDEEECNLLYGYTSRAGGDRGESTRGYYGVPFTLDIYLIGSSEPITFCLWSEDSYSTPKDKDEYGYHYFYHDDLSEMFDYLEKKYPDEFWYGPDCVEPTIAPDTEIATEEPTEVPTDEPVATEEPTEISTEAPTAETAEMATEIPEDEILVNYYYYHPMYIDYKTVSGEIAERIANGLEGAKLTSEKVDRVADVSPKFDDLYFSEHDVPFYTFWIEVGSRVYRSTSFFDTLALVDGFYGEGYYIELNDELKKDIADAWNYHPRDYYYGEYVNSTDTLYIEHKYEAYSSVQLDVISIDADEIGYDAKNSIVLEIVSDRDQSAGISLECTQGGCVVAGGDSEVIMLKAGVPQRVTLDFGAFESRYYIYISIDNTFYEISIDPN